MSGVYVGVDSKAKNIKEIYIGVNGIARRVIKAYVGVNGVAKECYGNRVGIYKLSTLTLSKEAAYNGAAAAVGNYAVYGGGSLGNSTNSSNVIACNDSLTVSYPEALATARSYVGAAGNSNYIIFAGGTVYNFPGDANDASTTRVSSVEAYNSSLTKVSVSSLPGTFDKMSGGKIGNYLLFAGGTYAGGILGSTGSAAIYRFNGSLTCSLVSSELSEGRGASAVGNIGSYILFLGGDTGFLFSPSDRADVFNTSLTRVSSFTISERSVNSGAVASLPNYVIFAGGSTGILEYSGAVEAVNSSLTVTPLESIAQSPAYGMRIGRYGLFSVAGSVFTYDNNLTKELKKSLSFYGNSNMVVSIGDKGYEFSSTQLNVYQDFY